MGGNDDDLSFEDEYEDDYTLHTLHVALYHSKMTIYHSSKKHVIISKE